MVNGTETFAMPNLESQRADIATTVASTAYNLYVLLVPPRETIFRTACAVRVTLYPEGHITDRLAFECGST